MAWPWLWESNFEQGTNGEWAAESDTGALLDFPHYSRLAQANGSNQAPFHGAFAMRVSAGDTNDHTVTRTDAIVPIASTGWFRFQFQVGSGWVTAETTNVVTIFRLMGAATTSVVTSVGLRAGRLDDDRVEIGVGNSVPTVFGPFLENNRWYSVEVQVVTAADITTGTLGSNTLYLDGMQVATVAGGQQTVNATTLRMGLMDPVAANIGPLLFDEVVQDDERIGPLMLVGETAREFTKDDHIFVGPGRLDNASLISVTGVATGELKFYDTDHAGTTDQSKLKGTLKATAAGEVVDLAGVPIWFTRGCYAVLTPTAIASRPRASVSFQAASEASFSNKRHLGERVKNHPADSL